MKKIKGVTLIELLVVMCIIGILAGIAYPSYQNQLYKIRRSDGQQKLLQLASDLEDNYLKNHTYIINSHHNITSDYYDFNIMLLSENSYRLTATPKIDQAQENDPCGVLSISDRQIMGPRAECWQ